MSERKPISARNGANTQRQRDHQRDQPGRHAELDDHHAVERAVEQHHRHADRDLEQRQPQQAAAAAAPASPRRRTAGSAGRAGSTPRRQRVVHAPHARAQLHAPARCRSRARRARCAPDAPAGERRRPRRAAPAVASACTGSIAGARSLRGNSRPTACITASGGVRGAKVNSTERVGAARRGRASARDRVAGAVVDQRVHGDDMVEAAERRVEHVADAEVDRAAAEIARACARARGRPASATGRSPTHVGAAPRRLDRQRAGAAAGVEHARSRADRPAASRAACARIRSRPARTVARMRPTGASEVSRDQASTAVRSK